MACAGPVWTRYKVQRTLQRTVQGKRKCGRQKKKWTDSITEWTKKTFAETQAVAHIVDSIGATVLNGGVPTALKIGLWDKKKKTNYHYLKILNDNYHYSNKLQNANALLQNYASS